MRCETTRQPEFARWASEARKLDGGWPHLPRGVAALLRSCGVV